MISTILYCDFFYIGAASHIIWDAFTHQSGVFVRHAEFLQLVVFNMTDSQEIAIYKLLQHLALIGSVVLVDKIHAVLPSAICNSAARVCEKLMALLKIAIVSGCISLPFAYKLAMKRMCLVSIALYI
ncbi:DUF4184 family protein [Providencia rettgeri]|uniref:DUF4184 family protein n=1 Tax=Providencia rettgeri TaxID=587 RepID=A0A939NC60_PRORE|nr:DUF4184 family protein [Providencia rettgeri]